jgi:tetratricopeptide (TPR) repeat protein
MATTKKEREFHRKVAVHCFNQAWDYLDKRRSPGDDRLILHLAHASRYHWGIVGTPRNEAIGDWQLSRVYAALGEPKLSLKFAKASLETCEANGLTDIIHTAYEGMARAYAVAGDYGNARECLKKARQHLAMLTLGKEERDTYLRQIDETESLVKEG